MKLYHGTNKDFGEIDLLKSKPEICFRFLERRIGKR